jgi:hypothetical protein
MRRDERHEGMLQREKRERQRDLLAACRKGLGEVLADRDASKPLDWVILEDLYRRLGAR